MTKVKVRKPHARAIEKLIEGGKTRAKSMKAFVDAALAKALAAARKSPPKRKKARRAPRKRTPPKKAAPEPKSG